jgi:hypothetical protein
VKDAPACRQWFKDYKKRWKNRLEQIDLWIVSHPIEIEELAAEFFRSRYAIIMNKW